MAAAVKTVRASRAAPAAKLAFEFLVLMAALRRGTAERSEPRSTPKDHVCTVPATRTKAKREHRVPLCKRADQILDAAGTLGDGNHMD